MFLQNVVKPKWSGEGIDWVQSPPPPFFYLLGNNKLGDNKL